MGEESWPPRAAAPHSSSNVDRTRDFAPAYQDLGKKIVTYRPRDYDEEENIESSRKRKFEGNVSKEDHPKKERRRAPGSRTPFTEEPELIDFTDPENSSST